ncbi:MAG: hypothetical protein AAF694_25165 [Bacteroidota bacterium]
MRSISTNITFSADAELIRLAREKAGKENSNLNQQFKKWYVRGGQADYEKWMEVW